MPYRFYILTSCKSMARIEVLKLSRYKGYWSLESQRVEIVIGGPFYMDIGNHSFTHSTYSANIYQTTSC